MLRYRLRESNRTPFPCPADMNPTLHALLVQRGIASAEEAERFLNPRSEYFHDPFLLSDMPEAAARYGLQTLAKMPIDPALAKLVDAGRIEDFSGSWLDCVADVISQ